MSTDLGYDENTNNIKYLIEKETWPRADDDVYNAGLELEDDDDADIGFDGVVGKIIETRDKFSTSHTGNKSDSVI
jgi:hypothetical protein